MCLDMSGCILDRYVRFVGACGLDGGSRRSSVDCSECVHPGGGEGDFQAGGDCVLFMLLLLRM